MIEDIKREMEMRNVSLAARPTCPVTLLRITQKYTRGSIAKVMRNSSSINSLHRTISAIYCTYIPRIYAYIHVICTCINDNDDKINQQYKNNNNNNNKYNKIYRYTYVYRYRPCHRMLIAKDQPCSACIVKHGFSNQTGFVRHSSRSDRAPCKRTVKTYKRTRTTRLAGSSRFCGVIIRSKNLERIRVLFSTITTFVFRLSFFFSLFLPSLSQ